MLPLPSAQLLPPSYKLAHPLTPPKRLCKNSKENHMGKSNKENTTFDFVLPSQTRKFYSAIVFEDLICLLHTIKTDLTPEWL